MGVFAHFTRLWAPSKRAEAIDRVVRGSSAAVVDRVGRTPLSQGTHEARGYIRSRALQPLRRQVESVLSQEYPQLLSQQEAILTESLEEVTRLVLASMREQLRTRFILRKAG